jgi:hypothetical protein
VPPSHHQALRAGSVGSVNSNLAFNFEIGLPEAKRNITARCFQIDAFLL